MLELDGSEGGGQLLRTALSLSAVTGTPFEMTGIRGARPNPGLRHQHLAAVEALATVADADVAEPGVADGDAAETDVADADSDDADETDEPAEPAVGTETLTVDPAEPTGGEYAVDVGTAGSVTLILDAVLPLATALERPLSLTVTGGTDVKWSPPLDYFRHVKLPLLREHGLQAAVEVDRRGFYPAGGGEVTLYLAPSELDPIEVDPALTGARVYSVAAASLAERDVADRQAEAAVDELAAAGVAVTERRVTYTDAASAGSAVVVRLDGPPAGFTGLGEQGTPSEAVAAEAVEAALAFRDGPGAVDAHMADQLVPYLALAGGAVRIPRVTDHVATCVELVRAFGYDVTVEELADGAVLRG